MSCGYATYDGGDGIAESRRRAPGSRPARPDAGQCEYAVTNGGPHRAGNDQNQLPETIELEEVARAVLLDEHLSTGDRKVHLYGAAALVAVIEMLVPTMVVRVAVVLDDRGEVLGDPHADAWRGWLWLSNTLTARDWPTVVTTTSLAAYRSTPPVVGAKGPDGIPFAIPWPNFELCGSPSPSRIWRHRTATTWSQ